MVCTTSARAAFVISVTFIYWSKHYLVLSRYKDSIYILVRQIIKKKGPSFWTVPVSFKLRSNYSLFFIRRSLIRAFLPVRSRK